MAVPPPGHCLDELSVMLIVRCTHRTQLRRRPPRGQQPLPFSDDDPDPARDSASHPAQETIKMKKLILAAFAALTLTAGVAPMAHAYTHHTGPYDNTGNSPGETGLEGGGG
jgi:hypothetical protein